MVEIIMSTTNNIPTKKIVKVLGDISAKKKVWLSENPEGCFKELKKEARAMGANAIINAKYHFSGLGMTASATGVAVIVKDIKRLVCDQCSKELPEGDFTFCPFCGAKLSRARLR